MTLKLTIDAGLTGLSFGAITFLIIESCRPSRLVDFAIIFFSQRLGFKLVPVPAEILEPKMSVLMWQNPACLLDGLFSGRLFRGKVGMCEHIIG